MKKIIRVLYIFWVLMIIFNFGGFPILNSVYGADEIEGDYQYSEDSNGEITITSYLGNEAIVTIPEKLAGKTVTKIGDNAFINCKTINKVIIQSNIQTVGNSAFKSCSNLQEVVLSEGLIELKPFAFGKTAIKSINIPLSLTKSEYNLDSGWNGYGGPFTDCANLQTITFTKERNEIPTGLFAGVTGLESVTIPDSVTKINENAFLKCTKLNSINLGNGVKEIGAGAFDNCISLKNIKIPSNVQIIGNSAFKNCSNLQEVVLSEGLIELKAFAFGKTAIKSINIPLSLTKSEYNLDSGWNGYGGPFTNCANLKTITFTEGREEIPTGLFEGLIGLESVTIPDSVTKINDHAFLRCINLTTVDLGKGVKELTTGVFANCYSLKNIKIPGNVQIIGESAFKNCSNLQSVIFSEGLVELKAFAFGYTAIESVTIPKSLTKSEYNYGGPFVGCTNLTTAFLTEGMSEIPTGLFGEVKGLKSITIPNSVTKVNENAFLRCSDFVINCNMESYALEYAILNGIKVNITNIGKYEPNVLNKNNSYYTSNSNNSNNYVIKYDIKNEKKDKVNDLSINLLLPKGVLLMNNTIKIDKEICNSYTYNNNLLTIPVNSISGTITFSTEFEYNDVNQQCSLAYLTYQEDKKVNKDVIGIYLFDKTHLSINADEVTNDGEISVWGFAPPLSTVNLSIDGEDVQTTTASKSGNYSATIKITNPKELKEYDISASTTVDGKTIERSVGVTYDTGALKVQEFFLEYSDHSSRYTYDMLNTDTLLKTVVFYPNAGYTFRVKINNPQKAKHVYVVSRRGGVSKSIEAFYDKSTGYYVTNEKFDGDNNNYVPGQLSVEIEEDFDEYINDLDKATEFILNEASNNIDWSSKKTDVIDSCDDPEDWNWDYMVHFSDDIKMEYSSKEYTEEEFYNRLLEVGLIKETDSSKLKMRTLSQETTNINQKLEDTDYIDVGDGFRSLVNFAEDYISMFSWDKEAKQFVEKTVKTYIKDKLEYPTELLYNIYRDGDEWLDADDLSEIYGIGYSKGFNLAWSSGKQVLSYFKNEYELNERYKNATTEEERKEAKDLYDIQYFALLMRLLCIHCEYIADASGPAGYPLKVALYLLNDELDAYQTGNTDNMLIVKAAVLLLKSPVGKYFTWIIDPSGVVYEALPDNRLEGATLTIYYKESENAEQVIWNAKEYNQQNPYITLSDGSYAWDVPEGLWQVKCEKDGYETVYTKWMEVPPPQTDVNISMISKEKPKVVSTNVYESYIDINFDKYMNVSTLNNKSISLKDKDGKSIDFSIEYVDKALDENGKYLANEILLKPTSKLNASENYEIQINSDAKSYADIAMDNYTYKSVALNEPNIICDENISLNLNETKKIDITVENINDGVLECNSNNDVVTIDSSEVNVNTGKATITLKGVSKGGSIVTLQLANSSISKTIYVTCGENPANQIYLPVENINVGVGNIYKINPILYPTTQEQKFIYKSYNENIATINENGEIKGIKEGKTTISVQTLDGNTSLEIDINVITTTDTESYLKGDVNTDNKITLADCTKILAHVKKTKLLTEDEQKRADVNEDGKVTLADYTKVLAHVKKTKLLN